MVVVATLAALVPAPGVADDTGFQLSVMEGEQASIDDLPFVVLVATTTAGCTGSVVAPSWVVTAAHCVEQMDDTGAYQPTPSDEVFVVLGQDELPGRQVQFDDVTAVRSVELHPDWSASGRQRSDIALLELATPTSAPVVDLVGTGFEEVAGTPAVVAGWGQLLEGVDTEHLMRGDVPILDDAICRSAYGSHNYRDDRMVCAGGDGTDACAGDSGGPLLLPAGDGFRQVAVVAGGEACTAASSTYGIYTAIAPHREWIDGFLAAGTPAPPVDDDAGGTGDGSDDDGQAPDDGLEDVPLDPDPAPLPDPAEEEQDEEGQDEQEALEDEEDEATGAAAITFNDVPADHVHALGIGAAAAAGVTSGYADGRFGIDDHVLRGQLATFLLLAAPDLLADPGVGGFTDVPFDHVHAPGIRAVAAAGIATGYADGRFGIGDTLTRGQMATLLWHTLGDALADPGVGSFPDVPEDHVHAPGIRAVAAAGITTGYADGRFGLDDEVTRGQMATFLLNAQLTSDRS